MTRKSNTVPYTNDRREGRTRPGLIEVISELDIRSRLYKRPAPNNRANRRRGIKGNPFRKSNPVRKLDREDS